MQTIFRNVLIYGAAMGDTGLRLVRVVSSRAPRFVAGFETDGTVRRAAPIIGYMVGWSDAKARAYIARKGWSASVISGPPSDPS